MSVRVVTALALGCVIAATLSSAPYGSATEVAGNVSEAEASAGSAEAEEGGAEGDNEELTIDDVMRYAMTQHLCKKVAKKEATPEEQQRLISLFETLGALDPPKGSAESWKQKTAALVSAAREVAEGKPSHSQLMKAANCAACHKEHRP